MGGGGGEIGQQVVFITCDLNQQLLDSQFQLLDLVFELTCFVAGDTGSYHWPGDATGSA